MTSFLLAQPLYRPILVGVEGLYPVGRWGGKEVDFPQVGYARFSPGVFVAKEYYNRKNFIGWFFFGRLAFWRIQEEGMLRTFSSGYASPTLSLHGSVTRWPQSFSMGVGVVGRVTGSTISFSLPVDIHISSLRYPLYELSFEDGGTFRLQVGTNTFLGTAIAPTAWWKFHPHSQRQWGISVVFPFFTGVASPITAIWRSADGEENKQESAFYLPPTHWAFRLVFSTPP
ncbi:MAG: hypothetical protein N2170_05370 [Bacteroidia bacterium]|nr:hypothetical protein [Bacteroidia bacterium]